MRFRLIIAAGALIGCVSTVSAGTAVATPAVGLSSRIVSTPAASAFSAVAVLPLPSGQTWFGSVAGSAQTLAATTVGLADPAHPTESAYAFGASPSGWASSAAPAQLDIPDPSGAAGSIAAADDFVAVGDGEATGQSTEGVSVFTRPATGWEGSLEPSATLDSSAPSVLGNAPLAATADAVFIGAGSTVQAFAEPASGWSGSLQATASLRIPTGIGVQELAAAGETVVVEQGRTLYVFEEPAGGWQGTILPAAALSVPDSAGDGPEEPVAIGSSTIAMEQPGNDGSAFVFAEPRGGWRNSSSPARLTPPPLIDSSGSATVAVADRTVVLQEAEPGGDHNCPCDDTLWAATPSAHDWPPTTKLRVSGVTFGGDESLTSAGDDVAAANANEQLAIYAPSTPPALSRAELFDPAGAHPRLILTLARGSSGSELQDIAIHPHGGLYLRPGSVRDIRVSGARAHVSYEPHTIEITDLRRTGAQVEVTIGGPVIQKSHRLSHRLAAAARTSNTVVKIPVVVKLMDQARRSHRAVVTFSAH